MIYSTIIPPFLRYHLHPIHHSHIFLNRMSCSIHFWGSPPDVHFHGYFFFFPRNIVDQDYITYFLWSVAKFILSGLSLFSPRDRSLALDSSSASSSSSSSSYALDSSYFSSSSSGSM